MNVVPPTGERIHGLAGIGPRSFDDEATVLTQNVVQLQR